MTENFQNGLWRDLELKTKSAYVVPKWIKEGMDSLLSVSLLESTCIMCIFEYFCHNTIFLILQICASKLVAYEFYILPLGRGHCKWTTKTDMNSAEKISGINFRKMHYLPHA
jgi:hypothetical protein